MSEEQTPDLSPLALPDGRSVLFDEPTSGFYRVRLANGEVQAFPARGEATRANAVADIVDNPPPPAPPPQDQIYADHLAAGFDDPVTGIKFKTVERAQAKFGRMCTLIDLATNQGAMSADSVVTLFDYSEAQHELTVAEFRALMLRYGIYCKQLFDQFAP